MFWQGPHIKYNAARGLHGVTSVIHDMFSFSLYILLAEKHLPEVKKKSNNPCGKAEREKREWLYMQIYANKTLTNS